MSLCSKDIVYQRVSTFFWTPLYTVLFTVRLPNFVYMSTFHYDISKFFFYSCKVLNDSDLCNFILGLDGVPFILNPSLQNLPHGLAVSV
jgi:hypothetical protein